jgi:hypothetical protein
MSGKSPALRADRDLDAANHDWRQTSCRTGAACRDHIRGSEHPTVTLVEYGDYQSFDRVTAARDLAELRKRFDGVTHRRPALPDRGRHPLALQAADVAEAAGAQGPVWEMHDPIYERNQPLGPARLRELAESIGLNLERFDAELAADVHLRHLMDGLPERRQRHPGALRQ